MRVCPRCTLLSPDIAERCDCGFDFTTASSSVVKKELADSHRQALRAAIRGLLLGIGALALTVAYRVTTGSSSGIIFFYAFGFGGIALAGRSITRIVDIRKARKEIANSLARR
jgi:hypothetical protein